MSMDDSTECRAPVTVLPLPDAPSGLIAQDGGSKVILNWSDNAADQKVANYKVYRATNEGGPYSLLSSPSVSNYDDTTGTANVSYFYRVTAVNASGESAYSLVTGVRTADVTAPSAPTITSTTVSGPTSVTITWTPPLDADLKGFNVYHRKGADAFAKISGSSPIVSLTFTDTAALAGFTWDYELTAVDAVGNESVAASTSIAVPASDTTAPSVPSGLLATDTGSSIRVSWTPNTEPDLAGYFIYRSDDGYTASLSGVTLITTAGYDDATAVLGTAYTYKVLAKDTTGNASAKSAASNSVTRPIVTTTFGDLSPFLKIGSQVPTVCHVRGVSRRTYCMKAGTSTPDIGAITTDANDFAAFTNGNQLTAKYFYDFAMDGTGADPGKYQKLRGWNAAHAYNVAGTYTVRFVRTDEKGVKIELRKTFTLLPDTRTVIYCASNGSSSTTNTGNVISSPVSFARGIALLTTGSNKKLLLRNGDTFNVSGNDINLQGAGQMISNYSDPASSSSKLPKINFTKSSASDRTFCTFKVGCTNPVVENLDFDRSYTSDSLTYSNDIAFTALGVNNVLIRGCTFTRIGRVLNPDAKGDTGVVSPTRYVLIQDCVCPNADSLGEYIYFGGGEDIVFLGNKCANSVREHMVRISQASRVLFAYNDWTNLEGAAEAADTVKTTINLQQGFDFSVYKNRLVAFQGTDAGTMQIGPLKNSPDSNLDHFCQYICVEENYLNTQVEFAYGSKDVVLRNNIIENNGFQAIRIMGTGGSEVDRYGRSMASRKNQRLYLYNNTILNNTKKGQLIQIEQKMDTALVIQNNLCVCPNFPATGVHGTVVVLEFVKGYDAANTLVTRNIFPRCDGFDITGSIETLSRFNQRDAAWLNNADTVAVDASYKYPTGNANKTFSRTRVGLYEDYYSTAIDLNAATVVPGAVQSVY
jgi:fibronectin type 3 domain-containing protein